MIELPEHVPDLRRLRAFYGVVILMLCIIIARLWYLQIAKGPELAAAAVELRTRTVRRVAARGTITDSKGRLLATNRPHFVVSVLPDQLQKNPQVLPRLSQLLKITEDELKEKIGQNKTTPFDPVPVASDISMELLTQVEEQRLDLPGVLIVQDPQRDYVDKQMCTHVLGIARPISAEQLDRLRSNGYRGGDMIGKEGIEAAYEEMLRGRAGGQVIEVDARGRMRRSLGEDPPTPGHTLRLTIDLDLQKVAYDGLKEAFAQGHPGAVVAMDPNDGAVLAFVSMPAYDLNRYASDFVRLNQDRLFTPLVNRASYSRYPVGSTFKMITAASALESGSISPAFTDTCGGVISQGGRRFHCWKRSGHGWLDLEGAIAKSCDVYFWHVAQRTGGETLAEMARRFGLGEPTGIDLPHSVDARGIVPSPEWKRKRFKRPENRAWVQGDLLNMAIGQGYVNVSPLQLANYVAAIANGGDLLRPQLVREILDVSSGKPVRVKLLKREVRRNVGLNPRTMQTLVESMARVVTRGTGARIAIPGLTIAAKTGTAEAFSHGKPINHSVFVCFAPVEAPKIVIAALVEGGGHGGDAAGPICRRMLAQYFRKTIPYTPIGRAHTGRGD